MQAPAPKVAIAWYKVPAADGQPSVSVAGLDCGIAYSADWSHAYLTVYSMTSEAQAQLEEVGQAVTAQVVASEGVA